MNLPKLTTFLLRFLLLGLLFLGINGAISAQDEDSPPQAPPVGRLIVTDTNVESIPNVSVRLYGRNDQGDPIDLSQRTVTIQSNGVPVGPVMVQGTEEVGTLTLFLIDIPPGVSGQLTAVQDIIQDYATANSMKEQVDYVAVYQVGVSDPSELLAPVQFHNSVRNLFVTPLTPEIGATALLDSTRSLINQIDTVKPNENMAASIVLITDGTDSVSTQTDGDGVTLAAAEAGVPVHTVWLPNEDLGDFARDFGQEYLGDLAAQTGGIATQIGNTGEWPLIWSRIGGFRTQTRLTYTASALTPGQTVLDLFVTDIPTIAASVAVDIPDNIPSITIDLPADARTLSVPNLERPLSLRFNTTLQWLDGAERTLEAAQLNVNGETAVDIPVEEIGSFIATTDKFTFGNNSVEVVVLDDQGILARSPELILTVEEGPRNIPAALSAGGVGGGSQLTTILVSVLLLGIAAAVWFFAWRNGWLANVGSLLPKGRRRRAGSGTPQVTISDEQVSYTVTTEPLAYLDVISTKSTVPSTLPLRDLSVKIGRSPASTDITFDQDVTVSREHAVLRLEGAHYRLYDDKSTSGTWVNDRQVPEYGIQLQDGDEIHLGAVHLRYRQT